MLQGEEYICTYSIIMIYMYMYILDKFLARLFSPLVFELKSSAPQIQQH